MFDEPIPAATAVEKAGTSASAPSSFEAARWASLLELLADPTLSNPDPTEFFNLFLRHLAGALPSDVAWVYGCNESARDGSLVAAFGLSSGSPEQRRDLLSTWQSLPGLIDSAGSTEFPESNWAVYDLTRDPRFVGQNFSGPVGEGGGVRGLFGTPLHFDQRPVGTLVVGFFAPRILSPDDRAFVTAASRLLAHPLSRQAHRKRPRSSSSPFAPTTDVRRQQLDLLEFAATGIDRFVSRSEACDAILAKIMSLTHADEGAVLSCRTPGQRAISVAARGLDRETQRRAEVGVPPDETLFQTGPSGGEAVAPTEGAEPLPPTPPAVSMPLALEVPIAQPDGSVCGTLALRRRAGEVPPEHQPLVQSAAKVLGNLLARFDWIDETARQADEARTLLRLGETLLRQPHLEPMLAAVADDFKIVFDATGCTFFYLDVKRNTFCCVATSKPQSVAARKMEFATNGSTLVSQVAREKCPLWVENARRDPRVDKRWIGLFRSRSLLAVPMIVGEQVVGVLVLDENRRFKTWTPEEVDRIVRFTAPVAQAVDNLLRHHRLSAHIDHLQSLTLAVVGTHEEERNLISRRIHEEATRGLQRLKREIEKRWVPVVASPSPAVPASEMEAGTLLAPPSGASPPGQSPSDSRPSVPPEIANQIREMGETFQKISNEIHPPMLDHLGLVPALRPLIDSFSKQTRVPVQFQSPGGNGAPNGAPQGTSKRLGARTEALLYRIVQEGLANVARHAQAESAILSLEHKGLQVRMTLTDDGKGFDVRRFFELKPHKGSGIFWIREYVELSGGKLFIDSAAGRGTRLSVVLPLAKQASKSGERDRGRTGTQNQPSRTARPAPGERPGT